MLSLGLFETPSSPLYLTSYRGSFMISLRNNLYMQLKTFFSPCILILGFQNGSFSGYVKPPVSFLFDILYIDY